MYIGHNGEKIFAVKTILGERTLPYQLEYLAVSTSSFASTHTAQRVANHMLASFSYHCATKCHIFVFVQFERLTKSKPQPHCHIMEHVLFKETPQLLIAMEAGMADLYSLLRWAYLGSSHKHRS